MKVTKDEAIQMLIELADYVDHAVIYLDKVLLLKNIKKYNIVVSIENKYKAGVCYLLP